MIVKMGTALRARLLLLAPPGWFQARPVFLIRRADVKIPWAAQCRRQRVSYLDQAEECRSFWFDSFFVHQVCA
jgi:hypothetical protein